MSGYTKSHRQKWQHPAFRNLREAGMWAWMCDSAVWKDTKLRFNGELVELKRGQFATSIRFISNGFEIGERATRTFLDVLVSEGMIDKQTTHKATIITICNYEKYQELHQAEDEQPTSSRQATDTNKKELKKERKKETTKKITLQEWEAIHGELTLEMVPKFKETYGADARRHLTKFRDSCEANGRLYANFPKALQTWEWPTPPKKEAVSWMKSQG